MKSYLVFSDLDGSLIDHDTYDFKEAIAALNVLKEKKVPVILCSSKTRSEIEIYRQRMDLMAYPFISENGGAIFIPGEGLSLSGFDYKIVDEYRVIEMGKPYDSIKKYFQEIKEESKVEIRGFCEMDVEEIIKWTQLPGEEARLASLREYSEPFVFMDRADKFALLEEIVKRKGFKMTKGGRFYHLMGDNDKGKAVHILKLIYQQNHPHKALISIGIGDNLNDFPMLQNVDVPVLVKKKTGVHEPCFGLKDIYYTQGIGPEGWAEAIFKIAEGGNHG